MPKRMKLETQTDPEIIAAAAEARRKYYKEYQTKNRERRKIINHRYWERKSREAKEIKRIAKEGEVSKEAV